MSGMQAGWCPVPCSCCVAVRSIPAVVGACMSGHSQGSPFVYSQRAECWMLLEPPRPANCARPAQTPTGAVVTAAAIKDVKVQQWNAAACPACIP